jgi:hypothetical protein
MGLPSAALREYIGGNERRSSKVAWRVGRAGVAEGFDGARR